MGGVKECAAVFVGDDFHGRQKPLAAHIAHDALARQGRFQRRVEIGALGFGGIDELQIVDQLEIGHTGSGANRVGGIGPAVADGAKLVGAIGQNLEHLFRHDGTGKRRIGRSQPLGDGDQVGLQAVMVRAEHAAKPAKTGNDLIDHEQNVVFRQHRLNGRPIA